MTNEQWILWKPPFGMLAPVYYGAEIIDNIYGLEIKIIGVKNISSDIKLIFKNTVYSYKSTDESTFQKTASRVIKSNMGPYYGHGSIFTVTPSLYIQWLMSESEGIFKQDDAIHFLIRTENSYIEIISSDEPEIRYV